MEHGENHCYNFGFHFANARKDVGVDGVGDGEFAKGIALEVDEVLATMVDGAGDQPVFPARVLHVIMFFEFLVDAVGGEAC